MILIKLPENRVALQKETYVPPLGLWSMRTNSPDPIRIVDGHLFGESYIEQALSETAHGEIVGLSVQFASQERGAIRLILKYWRKYAFVLGGPHGSTMNMVDVQTWKGPGEPFVNRAVTRFHDVKPPHFEQYEIENYWKMGAPHGLESRTGHWMTIETSRGCMHNCGFCNMPGFWGKWQIRPFPVLKDYVRWMNEARGIDELYVEDDNISYDKRRFIEIVDMLRTFGIHWSCPNGIYARSLLDSDVLHALSRSTCWSLSLPFETGSERTAGLMKLGHKWLTHDEADLLVNDLNIMGIETVGFFIIGYAGETEEDVMRTLDYANSLPLKKRQIYFATPYPGTALHEEASRNGWIVNGIGSYREPVIDTPKLAVGRLVEIWKADRLAALERKQHGE